MDNYAEKYLTNDIHDSLKDPPLSQGLTSWLLHVDGSCALLSPHYNRPSDRVRKKKRGNYVEILSNIMRKKVMIMRKRRQIMLKFLTLIQLFPWLFKGIKYSLTSYQEFIITLS